MSYESQINESSRRWFVGTLVIGLTIFAVTLLVLNYLGVS